MPRRASYVVIVSTLVAAIVLYGATAMWSFFYTGVTFLALRTLILRRLGGTTGDTTGALVEITETVVVIICAAVGADEN